MAHGNFRDKEDISINDLSPEDLRKEFYRRGSLYYRRGITYLDSMGKGYFTAVQEIADELKLLNSNLEKSNNSSKKLAIALSGIIIVGGLIALLALGFEVFKYFNVHN